VSELFCEFDYERAVCNEFGVRFLCLESRKFLSDFGYKPSIHRTIISKAFVQVSRMMARKIGVSIQITRPRSFNV
jgi:hypothetical protein